ncbi:MAG: hypothetical protein ABFD20_10715 [Anaerolineales bacterium]
MKRRNLKGLACTAALLVGLLLSGCRGAVLYSTQPVVLVEQGDHGLVQLADDDPRYLALQDYLAGDAALTRLIDLYAHTTAAFLASGLHSGASRALCNPVVLALGTRPGVLRDADVAGLYGQVRVPLALGVAVDDPAELGSVAPQLARTLGEALLVLAGQESPALSCTTLPCDAGPAESSVVLAQGLGAALEAQYVQWTSPSARHGDAVQRAAWLARNDYRRQFDSEGPANTLLSPAEASLCPGVVGTLFERLIVSAERGYPQRYMLWFANYAPEDEALAKIVLAVTRLQGEPSAYAFARTYAATFPQERESLGALMTALQLNEGSR